MNEETGAVELLVHNFEDSDLSLAGTFWFGVSSGGEEVVGQEIELDIKLCKDDFTVSTASDTADLTIGQGSDIKITVD